MAGAPQPGAVVQHAHPGRGEEAHLGGDLLEGLGGAAVRLPRAASLPHPGQDHGHRTVEPRHTAKPTRSRPNHRRLQQTPTSSRGTRLRSAEAAWLQTLGATQHCLNPGFSERIGNSRRTGQEHQDKPVLSVEAWARWRRASEYEDLLAEERVLGDKRRAGPDGVDADRAHQRCPSADGPQHVLDGPATFVDASTDGRLDGPGQPVQHAGLLSHRVLGSRGRGTRFSQQRLTALRRKPLLCGWTGQVASTAST